MFSRRALHAALVAGLAGAPDGKVYSAGFDDQVKEIEGGSDFVCASFFLPSLPLLTGMLR